MFLLEFLEWILNISIAKTCKFLWCIETELSLYIISWNVDVLSWYVILIALSCIELFYCYDAYCGTSKLTDNNQIDLQWLCTPTGRFFEI